MDVGCYALHALRMLASVLGGAPRVAAARAGERSPGVDAWLDADVDVLAERVRRRDTRPLLQGQDAGEVLTRLAAERRPIYAEAHLHVRTEAVPHARAVEAIMDALHGRADRL